MCYKFEKKYHSYIFMFCKIFFIYVVAWITEEIDELYNDKSVILYALRTVQISSQNLLNVELIYFQSPFSVGYIESIFKNKLSECFV